MTIISNNCLAGSIYHDFGLRFDSPTINIQILPEQYAKFCSNIKHYMNSDVIEISPDNFDETQINMIINMFGFIPHEFPYGLCDDILIVFQHYKSFDEAVQCWNRRKRRIDYNNMKFMFWLEHEGYLKCGIDFDNCNLKKQVMFLKNFNYEYKCEHYSFVMPKERNSLDLVGNIKQYQVGFDIKKYLEEE